MCPDINQHLLTLARAELVEAADLVGAEFVECECQTRSRAALHHDNSALRDELAQHQPSNVIPIA